MRTRSRSPSCDAAMSRHPAERSRSKSSLIKESPLLTACAIIWLGIETSKWTGNVFPWIAGGALILFGLLYLVRQARGGGHGHHFAIVPAMFLAAYPALGALNVMRLPLALRGVRFTPMSAAALLRRNLIYGVVARPRRARARADPGAGDGLHELEPARPARHPQRGTHRGAARRAMVGRLRRDAARSGGAHRPARRRGAAAEHPARRVARRDGRPRCPTRRSRWSRSTSPASCAVSDASETGRW
jgi:hypothetical protein